jgi:hypothetical protein
MHSSIKRPKSGSDGTGNSDRSTLLASTLVYSDERGGTAAEITASKDIGPLDTPPLASGFGEAPRVPGGLAVRGGLVPARLGADWLDPSLGRKDGVKLSHTFILGLRGEHPYRHSKLQVFAALICRCIARRSSTALPRSSRGRPAVEETTIRRRGGRPQRALARLDLLSQPGHNDRKGKLRKEPGQAGQGCNAPHQAG